MSKRDDVILLEDIDEGIEKIKRYSIGLTLSSSLFDEKTPDAVVRNFEVIGEATARLGNDFKEKLDTSTGVF